MSLLKTIIYSSNLNNEILIDSIGDNSQEILSHFNKGDNQFKVFSVKPLEENYLTILNRLHEQNLVVYVRFLNDSDNLPSFNYDHSLFEIVEREQLDDEEKNALFEIFMNDFVQDVVDTFKENVKPTIKSLHKAQVDASLNLPYKLIYHDGKLCAFLSWTEEEISKDLTGLVTTHWIEKKVSKELRKHIHGYCFNYLKSLNYKYYIASIFLKNQKSINLFKKNGYIPFFAKVISV